MNVTHVVVHTPAQVREIVQEATRIMDEGVFTPSQWPHVFAKVCDLLGARATVVAQPPPVGLDLSQLKAAS